MDVRPIEILLVEDNEDDIVLLQEAFSEYHLVNIIQVVRDGVEAMAYLRKEGEYSEAVTPGLVLLDINMPRKNGFEVLEELKADTALKCLPVIMLTVSDREEDVVRSYSNGACSYVRKPVGMERLRNVAREFSIYWAMISKIPGRG